MPIFQNDHAKIGVMDNTDLLPFVRYLWWMTPEEALRDPYRLIAQVMDLGDYKDVERMREALGDEPLKETLHRAQAGWFRPRSWHSWHYRLGLAEVDQVPPLPARTSS